MTLKKDDFLNRVDLSKVGFSIDTTRLRQTKDMNRRIQRNLERNEKKIARSYNRASATQIR